ncbi:MAG: recombination protein O N-terminal domain-containing protein [Candidatus Peribacteraceae bacterium]|jgi:DNA repair protein RecO (recombination protein O)|nr:recombination protein O N-terminal domain-containing protein [Candidatus Peribacteraceae bacterium]MDP7454265.1 recombination protein O N-terminal domain-containing protein [Candidatus Peribacteraceae bacterium]MDP7645755.1 recombination protein O N-terminal domain-containing protein [Candidatus Peribacteraceae bacterium]
MPHSKLYDSIILKAHDVGEADRFLILLTRERGRLSARAKAVRKLTSKLGGSLLPYNHVTIGLHEGKAGFIVTSAQKLPSPDLTETKPFLNAQQGVELLISLLHDDEPLPEIFDLTLEFLRRCSKPEPESVLDFTVNVLRSLGLLPSDNELPQSESELNALCNEIISEHSNIPPKASKIASLIAINGGAARHGG